MSDVQIAVIDQQDTQIVLAVPGVQGATGSSIPSGGTADQVLRKNSSTNYDANWTQVTSAMIADGTIVNADVNASAAIAGTKISPDFGGQTVTTTGQVNAARVNVTVNTAPTNGIYLPASNTVGISTNGTGRLFVDSSGRLLVGASSASTTGTAVFQGNSGGATSHGIINIARGATNPGVNLSLGFTQFQDAAGSVGAQIYAQTDAAWSIGSYAGRLVFSTTADGASSPTERLRITSAGLVGIGTSAPAAILSSKPSASSTTAATTFTGDGLFIDCANTTDGIGNYGGAISWSRSGSSTTRTAAITNVQTGSDSDVQGLAFLTHTSGTSANPLIEAMRITGTGLVGIGTTSPAAPLDVNAGATGTHAIFSHVAGRGLEIATTTVGGTSAAGIIYNIRGVASGTHIFQTDGTERARIDSSGRLLVGTSTLRAVEPNGGSASGATLTTHFEGISSIPASVGLIHNGTTAAEGSALYLARTRGTAVASSTLVALGDTLGTIAFAGGDGTDIRTKAAEIYAVVDGTPGADDMPGRLVFSTTADGASSPTEQLRITSDRYVRLASGTGGIQFNGDTAAANALDDYEEGTWTPALAGSTTAGTYETTFASGWYTKIGRQVTVQFRINLAGSITGGGVGLAIITGLPFNTSTDNYANGGSVLLGSVDFNDTAKHLYLYKRSTTSAQLVISEIFDNAAPQDVGIADFAASSIIAGSLVYFVS